MFWLSLGFWLCRACPSGWASYGWSSVPLSTCQLSSSENLGSRDVNFYGATILCEPNAQVNTNDFLSLSNVTFDGCTFVCQSVCHYTLISVRLRNGPGLSAASIQANNSYFFNCGQSGGSGALSAPLIAVDSCRFEHCHAFSGGAISSMTALQLSNCSFYNCFAELNGGAVSALGRAQLTDCTFVNSSSAQKGAAIYLGIASRANVLCCAFVSGTAPSGAAIYADQSEQVYLLSPVLQNNSAAAGAVVDQTKSLSASVEGFLAVGNLGTLFQQDWNTTGGFYCSLSPSSSVPIDPTSMPVLQSARSSGPASASGSLSSISSTLTQSAAPTSLILLQSVISPAPALTPTIALSLSPPTSVGFVLLSDVELSLGSLQSFVAAVQFAGTLTVHVNPSQVEVGSVYPLFSFASSSGAYDQVILDASSCLVTGNLAYAEASLGLEISSIDCSYTAAATRRHCFLFGLELLET